MLGTLAVFVIGSSLAGFDRWEPWMLPGLAGLVAVGVIVGFRRVRSRERWEAAWESYAAQHASRGPIVAYHEEGTLSMAGAG